MGVKRACDPQFTPLGEMIKRIGTVPFDSPPANNITQQLQANTVLSSRQQQMQLLAAQQQQQQQQIQQQKQQQILQQEQIIRNYQQQQAAYNVVVNQLSKSEAFIQLPPQQKQVLVAQYLALYQQ